MSIFNKFTKAALDPGNLSGLFDQNEDVAPLAYPTASPPPKPLDDAGREDILRVLRSQGHSQMVPGSDPLDVEALGFRPDVIAALRGTSINPVGPVAPRQLPPQWGQIAGQPQVQAPQPAATAPAARAQRPLDNWNLTGGAR